MSRSRLPENIPPIPAGPPDGLPSVPSLPTTPGLPNLLEQQRRTVRRQTHDRLTDARTEIETKEDNNRQKLLNKLNNNGVTLPDTMVRPDRAPRTLNVEQIEDTLRNRRYGKAFRQALGIAMTSSYDVRGLGFAVDGMTGMQPRQQASALRQLQERGTAQGDASAKLAHTAVETTARVALFRNGYTPMADTGDVRAEAVKPNETLEAFLRRILPADRANTVWSDIKQQTVVGTIGGTKGNLPPNTFVYLTRDGYPVHIAADQNATVKPQLYRRDTTNAPKGWRDAMFEHFQKQLVPGDVLLVNDEKPRNLMLRVFGAIGRAAQGDQSFAYLHAMVYVGTKKDMLGRERHIVAHVREGGGRREEYLDTLFQSRYSAASICRLSNDPNKSAQFLENAKRIVRETKRYDYESLVPRLTQQVNRQRGQSTVADAGSRGDRAVCVDVVIRAAREAGIENIGQATTAKEIFERTPGIIGTYDFSREPSTISSPPTQKRPFGAWLFDKAS